MFSPCSKHHRGFTSYSLCQYYIPAFLVLSRVHPLPQRVLKHTPEDHADHGGIKESLERITHMNQYCNDIVRPIQDRRALMELANSLDLSRLAQEVGMLMMITSSAVLDSRYFLSNETVSL